MSRNLFLHHSRMCIAFRLVPALAFNTSLHRPARSWNNQYQDREVLAHRSAHTWRITHDRPSRAWRILDAPGIAEKPLASAIRQGGSFASNFKYGAYADEEAQAPPPSRYSGTSCSVAHSSSVNSLEEFVLGNGMSGTSTPRKAQSGAQPSRKSNVSRRSPGMVA